MSQYKQSSTIRCPHYRSEQRSKAIRIRCEGLTPGSWIHHVFADFEALVDWRGRYCKKCWADCPIARAIDGQQK